MAQEQDKARVASEQPRTTITFTTADGQVHEVEFEEIQPNLYVSEPLDLAVARELASISGYTLHTDPEGKETPSDPEDPEETAGAEKGPENPEAPPLDSKTPVPANPVTANLDKLKAVELREMAAELGVEANDRDSKKVLIDKITAAVAAAEETAGAEKG